MTLTIFLSIILFLIGLYFYSKYNDPNFKEGLINNKEKPRCPNLLIQKDSKFFLYNSKLTKVPGVNPIEFNNLEEYVEFLDWQRSQGIKCPVLYLQKSYDAQGNSVYKARPSVSEPQGGLPSYSTSSSSFNTLSPQQSIPSKTLPPISLLVDATRNDKPYNNNSYPGFDQTSYYIGKNTPLDNMNEISENMLYSPNAMDSNWGGQEYTQKLVDKGYYNEDNVSIQIP